MRKVIIAISGIVCVVALVGQFSCDRLASTESDEPEFTVHQSSAHFYFAGEFVSRNLQHTWSVSIDSTALGYSVQVREYRGGFGRISFSDSLTGVVRVDTLVTSASPASIKRAIVGTIEVTLSEYTGSVRMGISPMGQVAQISY